MSFAILGVSPRWRFLVALLLLTAIAAWAFTRTEQIQGRMENLITINNLKAGLLIDMRVAAMRRIKDLAGLTKAGKQQDLREEGKAIGDTAGAYFELEAKLGKLIATTPGTQKDETALQHKITDMAAAAAPVVARIQQLAQAGQTEEVAKLATAELTKGPVKNWLNSINEMILLENELASQAAASASNDYEHLRGQVLLMSAGVILLGLVAAWFTFTRLGAEAPPQPSKA
jgi:hypothetical protein